VGEEEACEGRDVLAAIGYLQADDNFVALTLVSGLEEA
jgi:hypothetical protein